MIPDIGTTVDTPERDLYPVNDVAVRLGVTSRKVWQLIEKGRLRTKKLDGRRLVPAAALKEFIDALPEATHPGGPGGTSPGNPGPGRDEPDTPPRTDAA